MVKTPLLGRVGCLRGQRRDELGLDLRELGAPALGVSGAAIASNLALVVMAVLFIVLWVKRALILRPQTASWRPDSSLQRRLIRVGTPSGVESGFFQIGLLVFQRIMSPFGTNVIAAYQVASMLLSFSFIPGVGFSMAAATLVGQNLGAKLPDRAEREGWRSLAWTVGTMTLVGAIPRVGGTPDRRFFTSDPDVHRAHDHHHLDFGIRAPLHGGGVRNRGALRGAGDTLFPMITVFAGLLIVRVGVASVLVTFFEASIEMVWSALILDYLLKSIMFISRFRRGRWKTREV